jgi:hypothetical protein
MSFSENLSAVCKEQAGNQPLTHHVSSQSALFRWILLRIRGRNSAYFQGCNGSIYLLFMFIDRS